MADLGPSVKPSEQERSTEPIDTQVLESSLFTTLKDSVDNDVYQALKRHLLMRGKGRRPDLPTGLAVTNELLVQLYILKEEGQCSYKTLKSWLEKLETTTAAVTEGRIKHKIKSLLNSCEQTPLAQWKSLLSKEFSFHTLSEPLTALGLNRLHLMGVEEYCKPPAEGITINVAVALDSFRSCEQETLQFVVRWLKILCSYCATLTDKQVRCKLQSVLKKAKCLSRSKKSNELQIFLSSPFYIITPSSVEGLNENKISTSTSSSSECKECNVKSNSIQALERDKLNFLRKKEEQTNEIHLKNEIIKEYKLEINQLRDSKESSERKNIDLRKLLTSIKAEKNQLLEETKQIEKSKLYKKNLKLKQDLLDMTQKHESVSKVLQNERSEIDALKMSLNKSKSKIKSEQSLKSAYKSSLNSLKNENKDLRKMLMIDQDSNALKLREFSSDHRYSDDIRKTFYELQGEANVPAGNCSKVVAIVAKNLFKTDINESDLPCSTSSINFSNEAHVIAKEHVFDEIQKSDHFVFASDGTSRQKASFLEQHIILPNKKNLFLGYSEVVSEDSDTLLEKCINAFKEIIEIYCLDKVVDEDVLFKDVITKMKCLLSDRAAVMKAFDEKLHAFKSNLLGEDDVSTHFLFCNAHFLLALSSSAEEALQTVEKQSALSAGTSLGRDANVKFSRFQAQTECATLRLIRTAAEVFGPRCDEKSGSRQNWLAFCATKQKKSLFTSYRSNRFNNLFLNATAVLHHREDIIEFLTGFNCHDNLKLQSVLEDVRDQRILINVAVLSFLHVFFY